MTIPYIYDLITVRPFDDYVNLFRVVIRRDQRCPSGPELVRLASMAEGELASTIQFIIFRFARYRSSSIRTTRIVSIKIATALIKNAISPDMISIAMRRKIGNKLATADHDISVRQVVDGEAS